MQERRLPAQYQASTEVTTNSNQLRGGNCCMFKKSTQASASGISMSDALLSGWSSASVAQSGCSSDPVTSWLGFSLSNLGILSPKRNEILSSNSFPSSGDTMTHKLVFPFQQTMAIAEGSVAIDPISWCPEILIKMSSNHQMSNFHQALSSLSRIIIFLQDSRKIIDLTLA